MYTSTLLLTLLPLLAHGAPTRHTRRGCEVEHRNSTLKSGHHHHHHLNNSSAVSSSSASSIVSITTTALVSTTTTTTTHSSMTTSSSAEAVIIASSSTPVLAVVSASPSVSATTLVNAEAVVAPAAAPTGSVTSSSSSGNHVGLGLNYDSGTDLNTFTDAPNSKLSWYYTWSLDSNSGADGIEFVPMVWGSSDVNSVASAAESWPSGTQYVLSFNEPDQGSQANLDAGTAANLHQQWVKALGGSYTIGSPAVADGGQAWLSDWVSACDGKCEYSFIPFHYYGTDANALITYATNFYNTFGKPLWLTEWACQDYSNGDICDADEVEAFMKTAVDWFRGDGAGIIERWSWFGAFEQETPADNPNGVENSDGSANSLGEYYVAL